jgi:uncharacterized protein HemY
MALIASFRPFLDPLDMHDWWFVLIVPIALLVSLAYKAVRVDELRKLPRQVLAMSLQIMAGMIALGFLVYVVIEHVLPRIAPMPS